MMFDTKIASVVRQDLHAWQKLNVTTFLMSGIVGAAPEIIGDSYRDAAGNTYHRLCIQPVIVLEADQQTLSAIHRRALDLQVPPGLARVGGLGTREGSKVVDRITRGAHKHP